MPAPAVNPWTGQPYAQRLDPALARLLEQQAEGVAKVDRYAVPFPESRKLLEEARIRTHANRVSMHRVVNEDLLTNGRLVKLRWYYPSADHAQCTPIVYLHGGGWCVGSNLTHDTVLRHLAYAAQAPVCGVEYSLAPEYPFPAALEDVRAVIDFLCGPSSKLKEGGELILAGDSAGANLALVEAMRRRDEDATSDISALILYYGCYGPHREGGSFEAYGDGRFGLSNQAQARYLEAYMPTSSGSDWRIFPLEGELRGLPPTYVLAAELDPLYDDSIDLYRVLKDCGVPAELAVAHALPHGFLNQANDLPAAARAIEQSVAYVNAVARPASSPRD
ncbi:alpha/beta hydrolase [Ottowia thiooxydans]|uniref:alpha/beta hydrolase n=1 Tax=Ottowia thiooxydans TaxID=219182 RepID=UPI00048BBEA7|nr:alpha/beta hydrolase [Ottowia thiooxydans]